MKIKIKQRNLIKKLINNNNRQRIIKTKFKFWSKKKTRFKIKIL